MNNWGNYTQSHILEITSPTSSKMIVFYSYETPILIYSITTQRVYTTERKYSSTTSKQTTLFTRWLESKYGIKATSTVGREEFIELLNIIGLFRSGWL